MAHIELQHVSRAFGSGKNRFLAVDSVSFSLEKGAVRCLVGESGCGKSTTGKMIAGLLPITSGRILYEGKEINNLSQQEYRHFRHSVQIIHQDPYASLNPVQTVREIITTPLLRHGKARDQQQANVKATELLEIVDLTPAADFLNKYPHQLSGGQRQRVSVARALTVDPSFIVADEAVSMVDVSIRVSLLNMLARLRDEFNVGFLFITHDLALAKYFAWRDSISVMYLGRVVEDGPTERVILDPRHPYTQALLAAVPEADPELTHRKRKIELTSADIPSLLALPPGCTFHPRCPYSVEGQCNVYVPPLEALAEGGRVACPVRMDVPIRIVV